MIADFLDTFYGHLTIVVVLMVLCTLFCLWMSSYLKSMAHKGTMHYKLHRFVLRPGYVQAHNNNLSHYIGVARLAELYHLQDDEYITYPELNNKPLKSTDILLPPLDDASYLKFKEESLRLFYERQEFAAGKTSWE